MLLPRSAGILLLCILYQIFQVSKLFFSDLEAFFPQKILWRWSEKPCKSASPGKFVRF